MRPNLLFLFTDQQSAGMMSCAGNPHLMTPAMDSLAHGGARFERAYCRLTERVDAEIATVLQALEASGLADDTVIVFSSDHGEPREALVDLESDPGEIKNLALDLAYRELLSEHRTLLRDWYRDNGEALDPKYIM